MKNRFLENWAKGKSIRNVIFFIYTILLFTFTFSLSAAYAQNDTMYVMKNGIVIGKYNVNTEVDSLIFYDPFLPSSPTVSDYDGNVYNTVTIGTQVWMKENLKTTHYADGTPILFVNTVSAWNTLTDSSKAYCWCNDDVANKDEWGALYRWPAAMNGAESSTTNPSDVQGVCPNGWHLPSDAEWTQLSDYLGGESIAGGKLKETGFLHWSNINIGATNESGFTALPSGNRLNDGRFTSFRFYAFFFSSTEKTAELVWSRDLAGDGIRLFRGGYYKHMAFSVRCVKD